MRDQFGNYVAAGPTLPKPVIIQSNNGIVFGHFGGTAPTFIPPSGNALACDLDNSGYPYIYLNGEWISGVLINAP